MKKHHLMFVLALSFIMLFSYTIIASADESVITINFKRNYGTDLGDGRRMGGDWTIYGSGPEGTIKIVILFNDTEVYRAQGKDFSFRFNTYDYAIGEVNITVRAYTSESEFVSRSVLKEFLSQTSEQWILIGSISFAVIVILFKYGLRKKRNLMNKNDVSIDDVKIDG